MLVDAFPACGLDVSIATDGTQSLRRFTLVRLHILILCRLRLLLPRIHLLVTCAPAAWDPAGADDVNPIYYEYVSSSSSSSSSYSTPTPSCSGSTYTFPQSVGIAGGRPSPSYYFVRVQGDGLFYLEPPSFEALGDAAAIFGRAAIINTAVAVGLIARTDTRHARTTASTSTDAAR
ncbi:hypothetical protein B0H13DRAFT_2328831 [Mycena leptocephala]|nr:hypothetical protein B0H13DRAFT_2328831 [Mycena leptocephala]